jgi:hypothetical protein
MVTKHPPSASIPCTTHKEETKHNSHNGQTKYGKKVTTNQKQVAPHTSRIGGKDKNNEQNRY